MNKKLICTLMWSTFAGWYSYRMQQQFHLRDSSCKDGTGAFPAKAENKDILQKLVDKLMKLMGRDNQDHSSGRYRNCIKDQNGKRMICRISCNGR